MKKIRELVTGAVVVFCVFLMAELPAAAQAQRRIGGKPDLNGIWQTLNTAFWDLQAHSGQRGIPPGLSVVENNQIPYRPEALAKKQENNANRAKDPTVYNCYLPGVPRATYMPHPFKITHAPDNIAISYEFTHTLRPIVMDGTPHPETPEENWMGISRGRWDGDTLVVDVRNFNAETWFDNAGNYHSEQLRVTERYTPQGPDHIQYEATIEDPKVFTRPWKMSMMLYRVKEPGARLLEYECVFYLQDELWKNAPYF